MADERRLAFLVEQLSADERYVEAERRFPHRVSDEEAADIAEALQGEVEAGTAARAHAAAEQGITIACQRGCSACCNELVLIHRPEAVVIARWLARPEQAAVKADFLAAYPAWRAAVGDAPERLAALADAGDRDAFDAAHTAQWRQGVLCAFNRDGACTIYPVRPIMCRTAHALDTSERCQLDTPAGQTPERLSFVPLDDFVRRAHRLVRAAHHAVSRRRAPAVALCVGAHQHLTGEPT